MREQAYVKKIIGNNAIVQVKRNTACGECGHKCMIGEQDIIVEAEVENILNANVGDTVTVEMELSSVLSASAIVYGIPFAFFIIGCCTGYYFLSKIIAISKDILGLGLGAILMAICFLVIKHFDKKGAFKQRFKITMVK